jgi:hypothetical protein
VAMAHVRLHINIIIIIKKKALGWLYSHTHHHRLNICYPFL